jgi:limonene-1,2-epoxide hydrolase
MTTNEVANQMVDLWRQGKGELVHETMYAENVKSMEPNANMFPIVMEGLKAVKGKMTAFQSGIEEFHGMTISDPIVAGNFFSLTWKVDATFKGRGRTNFEEICVYQVQDDKIVLEQFFY